MKGNFRLAMILIVAHEAAFGQRMTQMLQERGYPAFFSCEGAEALKLAAQTIPELALVDLYLQNPSGLEVLRQLRDQGYRGKVILLSGLSVSTKVPEALHLGVDQVLGTPLALGQLESIIRSVIGDPPSSEESTQVFPSNSSYSSS